MRCKICDYRLWNIAARSCPECGEPFKPSEHQFKPSGVKFICPYCGQDYYGTGEAGHLDPSEFDCVQCSQHLHMDDMVVLPTGAEKSATIERNPWTQRKRVGFWYGFTRTIGRGMVKPAMLIDSTPESTTVRTSWWYMCLVVLLQQFIGGGLLILLPMFMISLGARGGGPPWQAVAIMMLVMFGLPLLLLMISTGVWICSAQMVLRWGNPAGPAMRRTAHAMLYSASPMILGAVPCLGIYIAPFGAIWWMVSAILMLTRLPNVSANRATLAALLLPVGLVVLSIAAAVIGSYWAASFDMSTMTTPVAPPPVQVPVPTLPGP